MKVNFEFFATSKFLFDILYEEPRNYWITPCIINVGLRSTNLNDHPSCIIQDDSIIINAFNIISEKFLEPFKFFLKQILIYDE